MILRYKTCCSACETWVREELMFSAKAYLRLAAAALAGTALAIPAAAVAGVVVKASGPSAKQYPVGTKLDDDATITLRDGDKITILTSKGTRVLKDAGRHRVGGRDVETRARFTALTRQRAASRVRTGAVRPVETGGPITSPNLWYVDVSKSAKMCLYDLETVRLWRPTTEGNARYLVSDTTSPAHIHVSFEDGEMVAALDADRMPVSEGTSYTLAGPEGTPNVEVTFALLPGKYEQADELAEQLIEKGCMAQLNLLADNLEESAG
ncbi:hypothetical protein ACXYL9_10200 [Qipengyuania sp. CAU 1752]